MMASLFAFLYPMMTFISLSGYGPQIKLLVKATRPVEDICLKTWAIWTFSNVITFGYATCCLHDMMFSVSAGLALVCTTTICCLIVHNRYIRFGNGVRSAVLELVPVRVQRHPHSR